jgi:hypothetical protein
MIRLDKSYEMRLPVLPDSAIDIHVSPALHAELIHHGLHTDYKEKNNVSNGQASNRKSPLERGCWVTQPDQEAVCNPTWLLTEIILDHCQCLAPV